MTETRIYTLAEVGTRLVQEINDLRAGPEALAKYEADLRSHWPTAASGRQTTWP